MPEPNRAATHSGTYSRAWYSGGWEIKVCTKCGESKSIDRFSLVWPAKKDGKIRPDCKDCVRERTSIAIKNNPDAQAERMRRVKEAASIRAMALVNEIKSMGSCVDCGEDDPVVLDFDHVRGVKVCDISRMAHAGYRTWRIMEEIEKCEIRCANCHRRVTHKRRIEP